MRIQIFFLVTSPPRSPYNFNFTVDWGDGTTSEVTSFNDPDKTHTYATKGTYTITISGTLEAWGGRSNWEGSKYLKSVVNLGDLNWIDLENAFAGTEILESFFGGVTGETKTMERMFYRAGAIDDGWELSYNQNLDLDTSCFDTSKVLSMRYMFSGTSPNELILTNFDTSNVKEMDGMFEAIRSLTDSTFDISSFNTSNVNDMNAMFKQFWGVNTLDLSHFDTTQVFDMGMMFDSNLWYTDIDLSDLAWWNPNPEYVKPVKSIIMTGWDTKNVYSMNDMFAGIDATSLDISHFDTSNVNDMRECSDRQDT